MKRALLLSLCLATPALAAGDLLGKPPAQEFLPVDEAFDLQPLERRDGALRVEWRISKGYYLYRERLSFHVDTPAGARSEVKLPPGEPHEDEIFGKTTIYHGGLVATLPAPAAKGPVKVTVGYQGCADKGLCYPPQTRTLELAR